MKSPKTTMIKLGQRMTRTLRIYDPTQGCNLTATTVEAFDFAREEAKP